VPSQCDIVHGENRRGLARGRIHDDDGLERREEMAHLLHFSELVGSRDDGDTRAGILQDVTRLC